MYRSRPALQTNFFCYWFTLTEAEISEPPCSFAMFQYQAFSDDLNSAVRVPEVNLWDTLTADFGTGNFMTMLLAQLEETGNENTIKNLFELLLGAKIL